MDPLERLEAEHLRDAVTCFRDALRDHREVINRLNVYPVPDGDTGTNMSLTLESVVSSLAEAGDMATTCKAISQGSLMGARGNSGVILSQVLRGISSVCAGAEAVGAVQVAEALRAASEAADGAVSRPVEGTILTVARAMAEGAEEAAGQGKGLVDVLDAARARGAEALERTPELLPVLREAGVVDAGGMGLLLLMDGLLRVAAGRALPRPDKATSTPVAGPDAPVTEPAESGGSERYEVMFFLEAPDESVPAFKEAWAAVGDSIVVAGGDGIWNCHIHTDDIGAAIEAAIDRGRPRGIRVTDLKEQVEAERCLRADEEGATTAVVAIGSGDGIAQIFRSLGAQRVVAGGQSMNPSTAELLEVVEAAPAQQVIILPNNKNIIPVAERVDEVTSKTVRVLPTKAVAEGLRALLELDPGASVDDNVKAMGEAAAQVVWGEITQAVRASSSPAGPISEGDWLGITGSAIEVVAPTAVEVAERLLAKLVAPEHELVTIIQGEGATEADTARVTRWVEANRPGVSVETHHGGQPHYPYLLSVE